MYLYSVSASLCMNTYAHSERISSHQINLFVSKQLLRAPIFIQIIIKTKYCFFCSARLLLLFRNGNRIVYVSEWMSVFQFSMESRAHNFAYLGHWLVGLAWKDFIYTFSNQPIAVACQPKNFWYYSFFLLRAYFLSLSEIEKDR